MYLLLRGEYKYHRRKGHFRLLSEHGFVAVCGEVVAAGDACTELDAGQVPIKPLM